MLWIEYKLVGYFRNFYSVPLTDSEISSEIIPRNFYRNSSRIPSMLKNFLYELFQGFFQRIISENHSRIPDILTVFFLFKLKIHKFFKKFSWDFLKVWQSEVSDPSESTQEFSYRAIHEYFMGFLQNIFQGFFNKFLRGISWFL